MVGNNRGYIKTALDGSKRMRFVKPGYDATDESVPPNMVIFDSQDIGNLAILEVGSHTWSSVPHTGIGLTKISTWDYGFVPVCVFQWEQTEVWRRNCLFADQTGVVQLLKPMLDGLYVAFNVSGLLDYNGYVTLHWTAFALDARS